MRREIIFPADVWNTMRAHLLHQRDNEQLAFLLAGTARGWRWRRLLVREIILVPPDALDQQTSTRLVVKQAFSQEILRRCYEEELSLIEVHSHPFSHRNVAFSTADLVNEADKFNYVARKIPHICHATMVVSQTDVDAHWWDRIRRQVALVDRIRLLDTPISDVFPTSRARSSGGNEALAPWLDRQVLAFGEAGQRRLQALRVGIAGCGGTGSAVVQMLAHLGVSHLVLVDPDIVELSNLNRLVGATRTDAHQARFKVHTARRLVRQANPAARVKSLSVPMGDPTAVAALKGMDMLFGCTDNHGSRLLLNQLAVQYLIPYLDLGAGLRAAADGNLSTAGGQVRLVQPGRSCLACIDGIDRTSAARDLMSPLAWERRVARGYVQDEDLPTPAVLFLNNIVASLAVAEFVNLWTGYRSSAPLQYYDLLHSRLTLADAERQSLCVACGHGGNLALGDLVPLPTACEKPPDTVPVCESNGR